MIVTGWTEKRRSDRRGRKKSAGLDVRLDVLKKIVPQRKKKHETPSAGIEGVIASANSNAKSKTRLLLPLHGREPIAAAHTCPTQRKKKRASSAATSAACANPPTSPPPAAKTARALLAAAPITPLPLQKNTSTAATASSKNPHVHALRSPKSQAATTRLPRG